MPRKKKKITFEECIDTIDTEIAKRRGKWNLTSLSWIDFEDVSQIIRIHIYEFELFDLRLRNQSKIVKSGSIFPFS